MKGQPTCDVLHTLVVERWDEYARPRFRGGTCLVRGGRGLRGRLGEGGAAGKVGEGVWRAFVAVSFRLYQGEERAARRIGGELDFELTHLQLLLLRGLEGGCSLCGAVYGVDQAAVVWREHPRRFGPRVCLLRNLLPACSRCAQAIDLLTAAVFRDVLMALKAEPDWVVARFMTRLGRRGSSLPPPPASNALAAAFRQAPPRKKGLSTR